jgi:hypothetical protein
MTLRDRSNDDARDLQALCDAPDPYPLDESDAQVRRRKARAERSEAWRTEAGVYKSWRPPNWAAVNSRRL